MSNSAIWVFSYTMIKSLDGIFVLNEKLNDFLKFYYETYSNVCITTLMCMKYLYSMHIINRKFNNDI